MTEESYEAQFASRNLTGERIPNITDLNTMRYTLFLILPLLGSSSAFYRNMCSFLPPEKDIDWKRVRSGPWRWAAYTHDELQDALACSDVYISGKGPVGDDTFDIRIQYGEYLHQVFEMTGTYRGHGEYHMPYFTERWRHIVQFTTPVWKRSRILKEEVDIERKSNIMFYTNYRNYFISAICMPNGRVSVAAYTTYKRARRPLMRRIYSVLQKYRVLAIPAQADCRSKTEKSV